MYELEHLLEQKQIDLDLWHYDKCRGIDVFKKTKIVTPSFYKGVGQ
jgi:hypothetical protein